MTYQHDTGGLGTMLDFCYFKLPEHYDTFAPVVIYSPELANWTPIKEQR